MDLAERLTAWNEGRAHGAKRRFAKAVGVHEVTVGDWVRGIKPPGAEKRKEIARVLKISLDEVNIMFAPPSKLVAPAGVDMASIARDVAMMPVLGRVHADNYSVVFEAPGDDLVPNPMPNRRSVYALRVEGDCMEPKLRDGDIIYVDPAAEARDKQVVVVLLDGEYTLKRYRLMKDGAWLVPDNRKYPRIKVTNNKAIVRGVVLSKLSTDI